MTTTIVSMMIITPIIVEVQNVTQNFTSTKLNSKSIYKRKQKKNQDKTVKTNDKIRRFGVVTTPLSR